LIEAAVKAFQSKSLDQFEIVGDNIAISSGPAISLSMVIHELCTNAVKHGALSAPNGRVLISWLCPKITRRGSSCIGKSAVALLSENLLERASVLDLQNKRYRTNYRARLDLDLNRMA
jgi:hypothetical protein